AGLVRARALAERQLTGGARRVRRSHSAPCRTPRSAGLWHAKEPLAREHAALARLTALGLPHGRPPGPNRARIPPMSREVYLEISPLIETQWTGIPRVAAELARCLLGCRQVSARFFLN